MLTAFLALAPQILVLAIVLATVAVAARAGQLGALLAALPIGPTRAALAGFPAALAVVGWLYGCPGGPALMAAFFAAFGALASHEHGLSILRTPAPAQPSAPPVAPSTVGPIVTLALRAMVFTVLIVAGFLAGGLSSGCASWFTAPHEEALVSGVAAAGRVGCDALAADTGDPLVGTVCRAADQAAAAEADKYIQAHALSPDAGAAIRAAVAGGHIVDAGAPPAASSAPSSSPPAAPSFMPQAPSSAPSVDAGAPPGPGSDAGPGPVEATGTIQRAGLVSRVKAWLGRSSK